MYVTREWWVGVCRGLGYVNAANAPVSRLPRDCTVWSLHHISITPATTRMEINLCHQRWRWPHNIGYWTVTTRCFHQHYSLLCVMRMVGLWSKANTSDVPFLLPLFSFKMHPSIRRQYFRISILSESLRPHKASRQHCGGRHGSWHGCRHGGGHGACAIASFKLCKFNFNLYTDRLNYALHGMAGRSILWDLSKKGPYSLSPFFQTDSFELNCTSVIKSMTYPTWSFVPKWVGSSFTSLTPFPRRFLLRRDFITPPP